MKNLAKALPLLFLTSLASASVVNHACGDSQLQTYIESIDRFNVGEVSRTEVALKQRAYLSAAFTCGLMGKVQYCYEAPIASRTAIEGITEEIRLGSRSPEELKDAQKEDSLIQALCANP